MATHIATVPDLAAQLADKADEIETFETNVRDEREQLHLERFDLIVTCLEAGMSRRAIAPELGCSHTLVQGILREGGLR